MAKATFGAGCFWGVEEAFRRIDGVTATAVGYAGGTTEDPTYKQVCAGDTRHAEVVEVEFDPSRVSYDQLLATFWSIHDPTQRNRQGPDIGDQYRSVIFFHTPEQEQAAQSSKRTLEQTRKHARPIATIFEAAPRFWRAEEYHQQYFAKGNRGACNVRPAH